MKTKLHIVLILTLTLMYLILPGVVAQGATTDQISQFGITWTFDKEYEYGQFANGDYWVVGPVNITGIDPPSTEHTSQVTHNGINYSCIKNHFSDRDNRQEHEPGIGFNWTDYWQVGGDGSDGEWQVDTYYDYRRAVHGSMVNPVSIGDDKYQGYDSGCPVRPYDPKVNAALDVPNLILQPGSSLVSTISNVPKNWIYVLKTAAILTVLKEIPPDGSFRPPYCGNDKTIRFNKSQLNYSLLAKLAPVNNTPSLDEVADYFERPWLDHLGEDWGGRSFHPTQSMPGYGQSISQGVGIGALMLNLDFTDTEKETLLIRFVQLGIDLYGIAKAGGNTNWRASAGHSQGRKWPILFAGLMLNDTEMKNIGEKSGDYLYSNGHQADNLPSDYVCFGEDDQTFYVDNWNIERCIGYTHGNPPPNTHKDCNFEPYGWGDKGLPDWRKHLINWETKAWQTGYRRSNTAISFAGWILAALIMDQKDAWNHDALFDYQDRYMAVEAEIWSLGDQKYEKVPGSDKWFVLIDIHGDLQEVVYVNDRQDSVFVEQMWDTYRANYPPIWTESGTTQTPVAVIQATPTSGEVTLTVYFDGSDSYDPDGSIVSYEWEFGDGTTSTEIKPSHIYTSVEEYTVTLSVTDDQGFKGESQIHIIVFQKEFGKLPTGCYNNVIKPLKGEKAIIMGEIEKRGYVKISLYDTKGKKIRKLADEERDAGPYKYYWEGKNDSGNVVGSGLYFVHIQAGDYKKTKKIVVVK